jgi:LacI family transcriptional regulator, galactose operon repressor
VSDNRQTAVRRIALIVDASSGSHRQMVDGVARFRVGSRQWDVQFQQSLRSYASILPALEHVDGVLTSILIDDFHLLGQLRCPVVTMGQEVPGFPAVLPDEFRLGALAGEHFQESGLQHVAYCGMDKVPFSNVRKEGFVAWARQHGMEVPCYGRPLYLGMEYHPHEMDVFASWLKSVPLPAGVFVVTTAMAQIFIHLSQLTGFRVPDQLAVLGVDEDDVISELSRPRLSMVDAADDVMGFQAAELLESLMNGAPVPASPVLVPPRRVIPHESTDRIYTDSAVLADAIRYIRQNACQGIAVLDVVKQVPIGRRGLEKQFRKQLQTTIRDEIIRVRLRSAKRLLEYTELPIETIAEQCGFSSPAKFSTVFRQHEGCSPTALRESAK